MKRTLLTLYTLLVSVLASAAEVTIDGVIYNTDESSNTSSVYTYTDDAPSVIEIPSIISYGGNVYNVVSIGSYAFESCKALSSITIPNSVTSIGSGSFSGCSNLSSVTFSEKIISIGYSAFENCSSLTSIEIPNNVIFIESSLFSGCTNLSSVTIPESITSIGSSAFENCRSLKSVSLPNSIISIGYQAFKSCRNLSSITIPASVTSIDFEAFSGCANLTSLTLEDGEAELKFGVSASNAVFGNCPIETLYLGRTISYQSDCSPFKGNTLLKTLTIGDKVTILASNVFRGCKGITSVTIPNSVTSIEELAFAECKSLIEIKSLNPIPPTISKYTFDGVDKAVCKIYVPEGSILSYWANPLWKEFLSLGKDFVILDELPATKYGAASVDLSAGLPEGVALVYESSDTDVARIEGNMLQIVGAGEATITASVPDGGTAMEIVGQMRQFIVDKADLTITAQSYEINAGDEMPEFELLFDGLINDDTEADIAELPMAECDAINTDIPGEYEIRLVGGADRNYNISCVAGKLTITIPTGMTGFDSASEPKHDVYNLQGVKLMTKATKKDLKRLPAGIYIINGKKVVIK